MGGADERAELERRDLVQLVDEQGRAEALALGALAEGDEQLGEVGLEVAGVGDARFRLDLEPEAAVDQPGLHGPGEARRDPADALRPLLVPPAPVDGADHRRQGLGHLGPQVATGTGLEQLDRPAGGVGVGPELQQQHGLADAAQPGQHDRLERVARRGPADDDVPRLDHPVPAGEQRRRRAGPWRVRVRDGIHGSTIAPSVAL